MREIKFRAWNKIVKQMLYEVYPIDQKGTCKFGSGTVINCELMQFTGLKDKNGKEIYEGDIVKTDYNFEPYEVVFINGMFTGKTKDNMFIGSLGIEYPPPEQATCKVIGNIFENPELLEKEHSNEDRRDIK